MHLRPCFFTFNGLCATSHSPTTAAQQDESAKSAANFSSLCGSVTCVSSSREPRDLRHPKKVSISHVWP